MIDRACLNFKLNFKVNYIALLVVVISKRCDAINFNVISGLPMMIKLDEATNEVSKARVSSIIIIQTLLFGRAWAGSASE